MVLSSLTYRLSLATYYSHNTIKELDDTAFYLPTGTEGDLISILNESGIPPYALTLKRACLASVMRNLCIEIGLLKNVRIQVVNLPSNVVEVQLLQP